MSKFVLNSEREEDAEDVEDEVFYDRGELDSSSNNNNSNVNTMIDKSSQEHEPPQNLYNNRSTLHRELERGDNREVNLFNNKIIPQVHTVINRTSTTLDDAVKVPVALQLPSRRTMFDVLMHLHNNNSSSNSNSNTESNTDNGSNNPDVVETNSVIGETINDTDSRVMCEEQEEQSNTDRANDILHLTEEHDKVQDEGKNKKLFHGIHVLPQSISDFDDSDEEHANTSLLITTNNIKNNSECNKHQKQVINKDKKNVNNENFPVNQILWEEEDELEEKEKHECQRLSDQVANRSSTTQCMSNDSNKAHHNRSSVLELFDEQEQVAMQPVVTSLSSSSSSLTNTHSLLPTQTTQSNKVSQTIYDLDVMQDDFVDYNDDIKKSNRTHHNNINNVNNNEYKSMPYTTSLDMLAEEQHAAKLNSKYASQLTHLQQLSALESQQATQSILDYNNNNNTNTVLLEEEEEYIRKTLAGRSIPGTQTLQSSVSMNVMPSNALPTFTKHNRSVNEIGKPIALTLYSLAKRTANNLHSALQNNFTVNNNNNDIRNHGGDIRTSTSNVYNLPTQTSMISTQGQQQQQLTQQEQQLLLLNNYFFSKPTSHFNNNLSQMNWTQNTWSTQNSIAKSNHSSSNNNLLINDFTCVNINNPKANKSKMTSERAAQLRLIRQLAQNKTGAMVVEYLLCAFKNWVVHGEKLNERNHFSGNIGNNSSCITNKEHIVKTLNECGVQLQIKLHRIDCAFHLVQITGEVIGIHSNDNTGHEEPHINNTNKTPFISDASHYEQNCISDVDDVHREVRNHSANCSILCTVMVSEQVACVVPFNVGECIYLAQPFWEFHSPSYIILASYNVTSDELIRQQLQQQHQQEELEMEKEPIGHITSHENKANELSEGIPCVEHYLERHQTPKRQKPDLIELHNNKNNNAVEQGNTLYETQTSKSITPYRGGFYDPLVQGQYNNDKNNNNQSNNTENIQDNCRTTSAMNSSNNLFDCVNVNENVKVQRSLQFTQECSHRNNLKVDNGNYIECFYSGDEGSERSVSVEQDADGLDFFHGPGIEWAINRHELDVLLKEHNEQTENDTQELHRREQQELWDIL